MNNPINLTEIAISEMVYRMSICALSRQVPSIDEINYRRLAYLLIETRRAAYKAAGVKRTLIRVLNEFNIGYDAYYDWRLMWYKYLPENIKQLL